METRDERYFINWFNHIAMREPMLYILLEDKERYLKTKAIAKKYKPVTSAAQAKFLFHKVWSKYKKR